MHWSITAQPCLPYKNIFSLNLRQVVILFFSLYERKGYLFEIALLHMFPHHLLRHVLTFINAL